MRERFIKNTKPLNPTHISPKKDKWPKNQDNYNSNFDVLV